MSSEAVAIIDRAYRKVWHEHDLEGAFRDVSEDFEWVVPGHPEGAVRHGPDSVIEFFHEWIEPWEEFHLDWELEEVTPELALATIDMRGVGRESGVPAAMTFAQLWTYRDGRFVRMVMYYDVDEARREAGLDPS